MIKKQIEEEIEYQERILDGLYYSVQHTETHLTWLKELLKAKEPQ